MTKACAAVAMALVAVVAIAQGKKPVNVEGQVRAAAHKYYSATIFGDPEAYLQVTRMPLQVIRDGGFAQRDEKASRELLAGLKQRADQSGLTKTDRGRIAGNLISLFDEASVQFVGANTAHVTFLLRPGAKPEDGDSLGTLLLNRDASGQWKVIAEITDSRPIPPDYLADPEQPEKP